MSPRVANDESATLSLFDPEQSRTDLSRSLIRASGSRSTRSTYKRRLYHLRRSDVQAALSWISPRARTSGRFASLRACLSNAPVPGPPRIVLLLIAIGTWGLVVTFV